MDKDTKELAGLVLVWWEDAQYWVTGEYGDRNVFNEDPDFVKMAKKITGA